MMSHRTAGADSGGQDSEDRGSEKALGANSICYKKTSVKNEEKWRSLLREQ